MWEFPTSQNQVGWHLLVCASIHLHWLGGDQDGADEMQSHGKQEHREYQLQLLSSGTLLVLLGQWLLILILQKGCARLSRLSPGQRSNGWAQLDLPSLLPTFQETEKFKSQTVSHQEEMPSQCQQSTCLTCYKMWNCPSLASMRLPLTGFLLFNWKHLLHTHWSRLSSGF